MLNSIRKGTREFIIVESHTLLNGVQLAVLWCWKSCLDGSMETLESKLFDVKTKTEYVYSQISYKKQFFLLLFLLFQDGVQFKHIFRVFCIIVKQNRRKDKLQLPTNWIPQDINSHFKSLLDYYFLSDFFQSFWSLASMLSTLSMFSSLSMLSQLPTYSFFSRYGDIRLLLLWWVRLSNVIPFFRWIYWRSRYSVGWRWQYWVIFDMNYAPIQFQN
jgi:hypothetical protein